MRNLSGLLAGIAAIALVSCNLNYSTTPSGSKYKIFSGGGKGAEVKGTPIKVGDIVKFNLKYSIPEQKDTLLGGTYDKMPGYIKVDTSARMIASAPFVEIFTKMKTGDSAELLLSTDSIIAKNPMGLPPFFKKGQHIKFSLAILNDFKSDSLARLDITKEQDKEKARETIKLDEAAAALDKYIASNNIKAVKTQNGVYIVLDNPGDISNKADSGKQAMVKYTGIVLNGKKPFDSNIDSLGPNFHKDPFPVIVGSHRTIEGWDEALPYFGKGAKGKIYIPAKLGYGAQQAGPEIPPYSNLVFDIEVLDVTAAPQAPQLPMSPHGRFPKPKPAGAKK